LDTPISVTLPAASELQPEPQTADLRIDLLDAYGPRLLLALSGLGTLLLLPFAIHNFLEDRPFLGAATGVLVLCLLANAAALAARRAAPYPPLFLFGPSLVALALAMYDQGLAGILWAYAAILLFHFVLPRRTANLFNATIVALAVGMSWLHLTPEITARVGVTLLLTLLFANIFSYIADMQRRKEVEQRQRLDLLVRGTNAGTLEWDADGTLRFSKRLRQMLGLPLTRDSRSWDFFDLVHPADRERVRAQIRSQFRIEAQPLRARHLQPEDYRLLHTSGDVVWVHTEGVAATDERGRTHRYICSFMDITEHVRAQETLLSAHEQMRQQARQLEAQNETLREAIRVREEVERIARHDLKTPLASIASVPRLLRERRTLEPAEEELLGMVERAALRVLSMVNLSLDLYRMEAGTYRVRPQAVDLGALAQTVAREVKGHADSKRLELRLVLPTAPALAEAEELLCYSIVANLVKNAMEAAPEGGTVRLAIEPSAAGGRPGWQLAIHNAGAVPEPVRQRFFGKYATFGKAGGTGLGAYSARLMARVQQGELLMATGEADGTTLTLRLPAWQGAPVPVAGDPQAAGTVLSSAAPLPALSVLLVDDDEYNVLVLKSLLPAPPLAVRTAINGRAALDAVAQERPDLIFLDLQMPVMGGLEAVSRIRELQRQRAERPSVIVAFSARDDDGIRQQCRAAGFDHYLVMPATRDELLAVLRGRLPPRQDAGEPSAMDDAVWVSEDLMDLMPEFVASRRALLRQLYEAASQGRREAVRKAAHTLAGSLAMYGFMKASRLSREIEEGAGGREPAWLRRRSRALVAQFETDQARVRAASRA
jgi:PAS domain S-box-containing protein